MKEDNEIVNFNEEMYKRTEDCRYLTVPQVLQEALEEAEEAGWNKCVLLLVNDEDGDLTLDPKFAGCSVLEARGIMMTAEINEIYDLIGEE